MCRQDLRNAIRPGSIVVFFSFDPHSDAFLTGFSAVATVEQKLERSARHTHPQLRGRPYINTLVEPGNGGWKHDETDRPKWARHHDWLWRLADHRGLSQTEFNDSYGGVYRTGHVPRPQLRSGLQFAHNYILFSRSPSETYICPSPPIVATAGSGKHEKWSNQVLPHLTVETAAQYLRTGRTYLRTGNGGRPHRHIHFDMPTELATEWRRQLIATLKREPRIASYKPISRIRSRASGCRPIC